MTSSKIERLLCLLPVVAGLGGCAGGPGNEGAPEVVSVFGDAIAVSVAGTAGVDGILYAPNGPELASIRWSRGTGRWMWRVTGGDAGETPDQGESVTSALVNERLYRIWELRRAAREADALAFDDEHCQLYPGMCNCTVPPCPWEEPR